MEVHAHTHTPRKKWTHYFWEFIMLFLAVFCGFLAENQREHMVEHQREKQYMESLLSDLAADTTVLGSGIPLKLKRINAIDSVFQFFNQHPDAKTISGQLFRTIRRTNFDARFIRNVDGGPSWNRWCDSFPLYLVVQCRSESRSLPEGSWGF